MKRLYTEANVRDLAAGSELVLGRDAIATPAALELAFTRGVRVRWCDGSEAPRKKAADGDGGGLQALLSADGEYVVQVRKGRARVFRLAPAGPEFVGEGG